MVSRVISVSRVSVPPHSNRGVDLQAIHEYDSEYDACSLAVEDAWRETTQKRIAERVRLVVQDMEEDAAVEARAGRVRNSRRAAAADAYDNSTYDPGASGITSNSHLDENGDIREMCALCLCSPALSLFSLLQCYVALC